MQFSELILCFIIRKIELIIVIEVYDLQNNKEIK